MFGWGNDGKEDGKGFISYCQFAAQEWPVFLGGHRPTFIDLRSFAPAMKNSEFLFYCQIISGFPIPEGLFLAIF